MQVKFGNTAPLSEGLPVGLDAPCVTYVNIPDHLTFDPNVNLTELQTHLYHALSTGVPTNRPNDEALLAVVHAGGLWTAHSANPPSWVECEDNPAFATVLSAFFGGIPSSAPADVEQTHYTRSGAPGVTMSPGPTALLVNSGRDQWANQMGGGAVAPSYGTSTATSATTLTDSAALWAVNAYTGMVVVTGTVYGYIVSNTATVLTVDRWYVPNAPGSVAGATPAVGSFVILAGAAPAMFMALSTSSTAPASTDVTLVGEVTTGSPAGETNVPGTLPSGLVRQIATFAHSAGVNTYTATAVYTANAGDVYPTQVYRMGTFPSLTAGPLMFETALPASVTFTGAGDQLTVTQTVTGS